MSKSKKEKKYVPSELAQSVYPDADWLWEECPTCNSGWPIGCVDKLGRRLHNNRVHISRIDKANDSWPYQVTMRRQELDDAVIDAKSAKQKLADWRDQTGDSFRGRGWTHRGTGLESVTAEFPVRKAIKEIVDNDEYRNLMFEYLQLYMDAQPRISKPARLIAEEERYCPYYYFE